MSGDHTKYHGTAEVVKDEGEEHMNDNEEYTFNIEPLNMFRFFNDQTEVLRLDGKGFHYKGRTIDDAGEAYRLFMDWLKIATLKEKNSE
jgi:hypothetical protein